MSIAWGISVALIGLIIGVILGAVFVVKELRDSHPNRQDFNTAQDRAFLLRTLRRELANYMVRRDPDRFIELYQQAHTDADEISQSEKSTLATRHSALCKDYPFYTDFDLIGTREHVLYEDAVSWESLEDIEAHYLVLVKFHAFQLALDEDWQMTGPVTSCDDLKHLKKYALKIKDTKFKQRIVDAIDTFYKLRNDFEKIEGNPIIFETEVIQIRHVYDVAGISYGIYFKDTDEYGRYSFFVDDDRDKTYYGYYRSDHEFEVETPLDASIEFDGPMSIELKKA